MRVYFVSETAQVELNSGRGKPLPHGVGTAGASDGDRGGGRNGVIIDRTGLKLIQHFLSQLLRAQTPSMIRAVFPTDRTLGTSASASVRPAALGLRPIAVELQTIGPAKYRV